MHDGIALERRGVPTAVLCTEKFAVTGQAMAAAQGAPEFPIVVVRHPIASLPAGEVDARADEVAERVVAILLGGGA